MFIYIQGSLFSLSDHSPSLKTDGITDTDHRLSLESAEQFLLALCFCDTLMVTHIGHGKSRELPSVLPSCRRSLVSESIKESRRKPYGARR